MRSRIALAAVLVAALGAGLVVWQIPRTPVPGPSTPETEPEDGGESTPVTGDVPSRRNDIEAPSRDGIAMPSRSSIIAGAGLSDPAALKVVDGFDVTTNGAVIENLDIRGNVNVKADNVTFRNVKFTYEGNSFAVRIYDDNHGTTFEHCEFNVIAGNAGIRGGSGRTVRNCEFYGSADGVKIHSDELYEYNYIHMTRRPGSDKHLDGMQNSGHGSNVVIRHNVIDQPAAVGSNAAIFTQAKFDNPDNILIERNYLNGGNYTLHVMGQDRTTDVRVIGNRFGRDYRYGIQTSSSPDMVWRDNVWNDTGQTIPE